VSSKLVAVPAKGDKEIGDKINKIVGKLADANDSLKGARP
jgi:type I restriction enzyme M protein